MRDERQKIKALMILEIIGKPPQYLTESLENIIKQIGSEQNVVIRNKNLREPRKVDEKSSIANASPDGVKIEEQKDFYLSFAELEIEVEDLISLVILMFKYMPAHIEILSPDNVPLSNIGLSEILNGLMGKLHAYDEIARVLQVEKAILESRLRSILESSQEQKGEKPKTKEKKK